MTTFAEVLSEITGDDPVVEAGGDSELVLELRPGRAATWGIPDGGAVAGAARVLGPFPFAFDTPGIEDGVEFYTPTVGDILLDMWVEITEAWNGTTPTLDVGTGMDGFYSNVNGPLAIYDPAPSNYVDEENLGYGYVSNNWFLPLLSDYSAGYFNGENTWWRAAPGRFIAANPLKVVASQDGQFGGAAVGGTTGAGAVYLVVATPSLT